MIVQNKKAFGSVVSTLIMFIAIVGVTTGMVIAFQNYISKTQSSFSSQNELTSNKLKTALSITNEYYNATSTNLTVFVKNIGETQLPIKNFDVFVNNDYKTTYSVVYASNTSKTMIVMNPQDTAQFIIPVSLSAGTHEVKIISGYGVGDDDTFNI
jgi:archaellum component FlaG (FlaF/FlaG flagellin family)